jgi:predicted RND superfamily exporter protein
VRRKLEHGLELWGHMIARRRWFFITLMVLFTAVLGTQLQHIRFDTHPEKFLAEGHPVRMRYSEFKRQFGLDDAIVITFRTRQVFSFDFLNWLRDVHSALEERVPHLDEVDSLINARSTRGEQDELIVEDLLEEWPQGAAEVARIAEIAFANPIYRNFLLSEDGRLTSANVRLTVYSSLGAGLDEFAGFDQGAQAPGPVGELEFLTGTEMGEAVVAVRAVLDEFARDDVEVYLAGNPVMVSRLTGDMQRDLRVFLSLSIATILIILGVLFRRASGVFLPPLVVLLSLISTFGIAGIRGSTLNVSAQIMPSFLLAVGTSAAVHLLVMFFRYYDRGATRVEAVAGALGHSGLAIIMTSLTTAGGMASFLAAELTPVADLGVLTPVGILLGLVYCLVLLPALLVTVPQRRKPHLQREGQPRLVERILVAGGDMAVSRPATVVGVTVLIIVFAAVGSTRLVFVHDPMSWFPEGDPLRVSTDVIGHEMGGTLSLEVLADTGVENGLHGPAVMNALEELRRRSPEFRGGQGIEIRKTLSVVDILKEIHQALNENRPEFYAVPQDRQLIAQELLLFENSGSDDLEDFVDSQFSMARFTMRGPWAAPQYYGPFIPDVENAFQRLLGETVDVRTTGLMSLMTAAVAAIKVGMIRSYLMALIIITPLMMLLIGTLRGGLVSMVPNLAPIICVLGFMGWVGMDLDMFKIMIGSIAIGLAVDDTIHFMHNFYRYFGETGDTRGSVRRTMQTTGQALLTTSVVLTVGFLIYSFSAMKNLASFGLLTALAIILAFLADVIVAPALVTLATRGKRVPVAQVPVRQETFREAP